MRAVVAAALPVLAGVLLTTVPAASAASDDDLTGRTTLDTTLAPGTTAFRSVVERPGEPHRTRRDLTKPRRGRESTRSSLLYFGQIADPHITDEMSPARLEMLDVASGVFAGAWRPQEALADWVLDSAVRNLNANTSSPIVLSKGRRARMAFTLVTGDIADNAQLNEFSQARGVLNGTTVDPFSGVAPGGATGCPGITPDRWWLWAANAGRRYYSGVSDFTDWSGQSSRYAAYWDPNGGGRRSGPTSAYSAFPRFPGLMDTAQRRIKAAGLDVPWYVALGEHDTGPQGVLRGNMPLGATPLSDVALGCRKLWPNNFIDPASLTALGSMPGALLALSGPDTLPGRLFAASRMRWVPPDPARRVLRRSQLGFGFGPESSAHGLGLVEPAQSSASAGSAAYYAFDKGNVRVIVLDTSGVGGGGNIDDPQYRWLARELDASTSVEYRRGRIVRDADPDRLIVVVGHDSLEQLANPFPDEVAGRCTDAAAVGCDEDPRGSAPIHLGTAGAKPLRDLLLQYPAVVAYIHGGEHRHRIRALRAAQVRGAPKGYRSGLWQIGTASLLDWPQQARTIDLLDNRDGTLSLFTTVVDTAAPAKAPVSGTAAAGMSDSQLASVARRLSANDPQSAALTGGTSSATDRNAELLVPDPRVLSARRPAGGR